MARHLTAIIIITIESHFTAVDNLLSPKLHRSVMNQTVSIIYIPPIISITIHFNMNTCTHKRKHTYTCTQHDTLLYEHVMAIN